MISLLAGLIVLVTGVLGTRGSHHLDVAFMEVLLLTMDIQPMMCVVLVGEEVEDHLIRTPQHHLLLPVFVLTIQIIGISDFLRTSIVSGLRHVRTAATRLVLFLAQTVRMQMKHVVFAVVVLRNSNNKWASVMFYEL